MFEPDQMFVYHRVPPNFTGDTLCPLGMLSTVAPEIAEVQRAKYQGREWILTCEIPPLNCLWNDVLMFSPVHPADLLNALREGGRSVPRQEWYEIDAVLLSEKHTTLLVLEASRRDSPTLEDYLSFTPSHLKEHSFLSIEALERLKTTPHSERPFLFADVPHVMFRGTLRQADLKIITV